MVQTIAGLRERSMAALSAREPTQGSADCTTICFALKTLVERITTDLERLEKEDPASAVASLELDVKRCATGRCCRDFSGTSKHTSLTLHGAAKWSARNPR
jgi:hypothetical protein